MSAEPRTITSTGTVRGYIDAHALDELWFHTGTACNLACPFCLEGSKPGDNRLQRIMLADARPFIDEAIELGVKQFSFTGGEPFVVKDFVNILEYAATYRPCLVLTNGTDPVLQRLHQLEALTQLPHPIFFRISIDYADERRHDSGRGSGNFAKALEGMQRLHEMGFSVSVARQAEPEEDVELVTASFRDLLATAGLPTGLRIVAFQDFGEPDTPSAVPDVTEQCMTQFHTGVTRRDFMCAFSKMVIKIGGRMRVYACTLVDDDPEYDMGASLRESLTQRVLLKHHRCYSCFAYGSSCSELA
jgi:hypothetical protein